MILFFFRYRYRYWLLWLKSGDTPQYWVGYVFRSFETYQNKTDVYCREAADFSAGDLVRQPRPQGAFPPWGRGCWFARNEIVSMT